MKHTLLLFSLLLSSSIWAQKPNDWGKYHLHQPVKTVKQQVYAAEAKSNGKARLQKLGPTALSYKLQFQRNGNLRFKKYLDLKIKNHYLYNINHDPKEIKHLRKGKEFARSKFHYDRDNFLHQIDYMVEDEILDRYSYQTNSYGIATKESYAQPTDTQSVVTICSYTLNKKMQLTESITAVFWKANEEPATNLHEFNYEDTTSDFRKFTAYERFPPELQEANKELGVTAPFDKLSPDQNGHYIHYYDENGNLIRWESVKKKVSHVEEKHRFEYRYDEYRNWVEKKEYKNEVLIRIIKRKLKYYPIPNEKED